jgi:nicotinamide-nucleotide amidase
MAESLKERAETVVKLAVARGATLATVESCTAGSFAHLLSQAEGASTVLHGGFIVYTKENKRTPSACRKSCLPRTRP